MTDITILVASPCDKIGRKLAMAVTSIITLAATIFFLFRKIGDTTHVDLNTVRGDEWDE